MTACDQCDPAYRDNPDDRRRYCPQCQKEIDDAAENPVTLQPVITQGTGTTPATGLDPVAPGGPGQSRAWGAELLAFIFGDDEPLAMNDPNKPGCCPDGQPRCLKCWLRENVRWLLLIGLVGAVVWFKRKP